MKRRAILVISVALAIAAIGCGKKEKETNKIQVVKAQTGLVMRQAPDLNSPKVTLVPYGEEVEVVEEQASAVEINSVSGKWKKVTWKENTAWVFGGFLKEKEINSPDIAIERYYKMGITLEELLKQYKEHQNDQAKFDKLVKNDLLENYKSIMTGSELATWTSAINEGSMFSGYFAEIYSGLSATKIVSKKEEKINEDELRVSLTVKEEEPYNLEFGPDLKSIIKTYNVKNITQDEFNKKTAGKNDTELHFTIHRNVEQTFTMKLMKGSWYITKIDRKVIDSEILF
ncbi:MAG: hypothetical protein CVV49_11760 [Spirochaetae bacterium HGW-Spirochaetae-5]|nr:MAG: hypothetical protein CVV49_11760 [Spirochaetae bacterium HGW-Spirochaetae-5]